MAKLNQELMLNQMKLLVFATFSTQKEVMLDLENMSSRKSLKLDNIEQNMLLKTVWTGRRSVNISGS